MSGSPADRRLVVVAPPGAAPGRWDAVVGTVAAITDAQPVPGTWPAGGSPDGAPGRGPAAGPDVGLPGGRDETFLRRILEQAVGTPLLVLPGPEPSRSHEPAAVRRMLVPMDRSLSERRVLRPLIERARALGIGVHQLHVLGPTSRPAMWEGPGHHADAWLAELRRRHQPEGTALTVVGGNPVEQVLSAGRDTDLVVICWHGDAAASRAHVVRGIVERIGRPLLLVPV